MQVLLSLLLREIEHSYPSNRSRAEGSVLKLFTEIEGPVPAPVEAETCMGYGPICALNSRPTNNRQKSLHASECQDRQL